MFVYRRLAYVLALLFAVSFDFVINVIKKKKKKTLLNIGLSQGHWEDYWALGKF